MPQLNNTELEVFKTCLALVVLSISWLVGTRVINYWELKKKQKEQNILAATEFHKLYGEFTSVWRLWKVHLDNFPTRESLDDKSKERYWDLLKRASTVEGGMESFFVKLASEKILLAREAAALGLFRQAIQQLRQSIRDFDEMEWKRENQEYILLKELTITTKQLLNKSSKIPDEKTAKKQLKEITDVNSNDWSARVRKTDSKQNSKSR